MDAEASILVVDDDKEVREAVAGFLREHGFRVIVAAGGQQAIAVMSDRRTRFCLVLVDWSMPEVGGREVIAWMARQVHVADTPVYVLAATPELVPTKLPVIDKLDLPAVLRAAGWRCRKIARPPA